MSTESRHDRGDHDWAEHDGRSDGHCKKDDGGPRGDEGEGPHGDEGEWSKGDGPRGDDPRGGPWKDKGEAPKAKGGKAKAYGGDGGHANTGNVQFLNGNALALSFGKELREPLSGKGDRYDRGRHDGAEAEGGDTCAESGDAYGGDGGDAFASGGDAENGSRPLLATCGLPGRRYGVAGARPAAVPTCGA